MLPRFEYFKARGLADALDLLSRHGASARLLAGGTDLLVDMRERRQRPAALIDISELRELREIRTDVDAIRIGAGATVGAVLTEDTIRRECPALSEACRSFADYLTRNKATIGGNLANASPGADLVVPLLALEASVVLAAATGERTVAVGDFVQGPRKTALRAGELVREIVVPRRPLTGQAYEKLGLRQGGAIAVVSSAVLMSASDGACTGVRIALGAVAPRPFRAQEAERAIEGRPFSAEAVGRAAHLAAKAASPITDVRGSAEYRRAMVAALVRRGLAAAWERVAGASR